MSDGKAEQIARCTRLARKAWPDWEGLRVRRYGFDDGTEDVLICDADETRLFMIAPHNHSLDALEAALEVLARKRLL